MARNFRCRGCAAALLLWACACAPHREPATAPAPDRLGKTEIEHLQAPYEAPPDGATLASAPLELAPEPIREDLPGYPEVALAAEVSCTARLLSHVETDGSVSLVRLSWDVPPPEEYRAAFESAIREAVAAWIYRPAMRVVPERKPDGAIEPRLQPIRYAARAVLRFRVESGKGVVH